MLAAFVRFDLSHASSIGSFDERGWEADSGQCLDSLFGTELFRICFAVSDPVFKIDRDVRYTRQR